MTIWRGGGRKASSVSTVAQHLINCVGPYLTPGPLYTVLLISYTALILLLLRTIDDAEGGRSSRRLAEAGVKKRPVIKRKSDDAASNSRKKNAAPERCSISNIPTVDATDHLAVFNYKPKYDSDSDYDGFVLPDKPIGMLMVGDLVVHFKNPYVHGNLEGLDWGQVISIETSQDADGDKDANVMLDSYELAS